MDRDSNQPVEQSAGIRSQLAGDMLHLRRLWVSVQRATIAIEQATAAYLESRSLLERIDGVPHSLIVGEIRVAD
jgi:hypothetical protein